MFDVSFRVAEDINDVSATAVTQMIHGSGLTLVESPDGYLVRLHALNEDGSELPDDE
jgi:hypothetical protein